MPDDLSGKVILVTGAGRGIGRATALAFASEGARVVVAGRTRKQIKAVRDEIKVQGRTALAVSADVSKPRDVKALMRAALDKYGGIDLLVNNAGVLEPIAPIWSARPKDWRNNISINLIGLYSCAREVMRHMMQHSGGAIINVSSGAARNPRYGWSAYCTAKAAVDQLTRCMGLTVGSPGGKIAGPRFVDGSGTQLVRSTVVHNHTLRRAVDVERAERRSTYPPCLAKSLRRTAEAAGGVIRGQVKSQRLSRQGTNDSGSAVRLTYVTPVNGTDKIVYLDRYALRQGRTFVNISFFSNRDGPSMDLERSVANRVRHRLTTDTS